MSQDGASISLTLPVEGFADVARRVVGGVAGRSDLGFEAVDDVQLALELVLRSGAVTGDSATIAIDADPAGLTVRVGRVDTRAARQRLRAEPGSRMALGDILERLVDDVNVTRGPLPEVVLRKSLFPGAA